MGIVIARRWQFGHDRSQVPMAMSGHPESHAARRPDAAAWQVELRVSGPASAGVDPIAAELEQAEVDRSYLSLCLFLGVMVGGAVLLTSGLNRIGRPLASRVVLGLTTPYLAILTVRSLGWFYFCKREELGWD